MHMQLCLANLPCQYVAMSAESAGDSSARKRPFRIRPGPAVVGILDATYAALRTNSCATARKLRSRGDVSCVTNTAYGATNKQP